MSGDALTRGTIRLALLLYLAAVAAMPWLGPAGWGARDTLGRIVRAGWALGWLLYAAHVGLAFHYFHGWSHAAAVRHVEEQSGFGPGIAFSHLFTLLWGADVAWWCAGPESYARRPRWVGIALHGYLLFVAFNATVVYETGAVRAAGIAGTALVAASFGLSFRRPAIR